MDFTWALVVACAIHDAHLNVGTYINSEQKIFYLTNMKSFFLLLQCEGFLSIDDKVLSMDPPFHPLMVRSSATSMGNKRRTGRCRHTKAGAG